MWLGIKNVIRANHTISLITSSTMDPWVFGEIFMYIFWWKKIVFKSSPQNQIKSNVVPFQNYVWQPLLRKIEIIAYYCFIWSQNELKILTAAAWQWVVQHTFLYLLGFLCNFSFRCFIPIVQVRLILILKNQYKFSPQKPSIHI